MKANMAASIQGIGKFFCRVSPPILQAIRHNKSCLQKLPVRLWTQTGRPFVLPNHSFCTAASLEDGDAAEATVILARYKDRPWDYLESEEYIERYGTSPVWADYRRNHKGGIPPQKTRKTCIRGGKICGNPCPICRDTNVIVHYRNVKLLQQFLSPHTGMVYDPTRTGVCMKQQKLLNKAIDAARAHGLLPFQIPYVEFSGEDYSNSHPAVGYTPPPSNLTSGDPWYKWYGTMEADEKEVAKVKKIYKAYLKEGISV